VSEATKRLPFSAMTISRAIRQLEAVNLFEVSKDGVYKVEECKIQRIELFQKLKKYLSSPVRTTGY
jgi:arginine repressor